MICLTLPIVNAGDKKPVFKNGKTVTPSDIELKPVDGLASMKKLVGIEADTDVEVVIKGERIAKIPEDSPLRGIEPTEECLKLYPYGSWNWYQCEGGS